MTCPTGHEVSRWLVVNTATGERFALVTRLEGAVAVAARGDFDPEAWLRDLIAREYGRNRHVQDVTPQESAPSSWRFMAGA